MVKLRVLSLDPGETTGFAVVDFSTDDKNDFAVVAEGEISTNGSWGGLTELFLKYDPTVVVYETFILYDYKAQSKSWSEFPTIQTIGVAKYLCQALNKSWTKQPANQAKHFFHDKRLKAMNIYNSKSRHSRDAIRHAFYFRWFGGGKDNAWQHYDSVTREITSP